MTYVLIYGGMRLDMSEIALRDMNLRPGQHVPNELVGECIRARARAVCTINAMRPDPEDLSELAEWSGWDKSKHLGAAAEQDDYLSD